MNQLKAAWQTFSNEAMSSDLIKVGTAGLTGFLDILQKIIDTIGGFGTLGIAGALFAGFKKREGISNIFKGALDSFNVSVDAGISKMESFKKSAKGAFGNVMTFMKGTGGILTGIGAIVTAVGIATSAYQKFKEEQRADRQEKIDAGNTFNEAFGGFEQAYVKYSGKSVLTMEEENELATAINGTVSALGDKAAALEGVVNSSDSYFSSLEQIAQAELEAQKMMAQEAKQAAKEQLLDDIDDLDWWNAGHKKIDFSMPASNSEWYKVASDSIEQFKELGYIKKDIRNGVDVGDWFSFDTNDVDKFMSQFYAVKNLKDELANADVDGNIIDTADYEQLSKSIEMAAAAAEEYIKQTYNVEKSSYEMSKGIPKTVDDFYAMQEAVVSASSEYVNVREQMANALYEDYKDAFDLSTIKAQTKQIQSITGIDDNKARRIETFLEMRTMVNDGDCSVGEYMSAVDDIESTIGELDEESQAVIRTKLNLEFDENEKSKDQIVKMRDKFLNDLKDAGWSDSAATQLVDELSSKELEAAINLAADCKLDLKSVDAEGLKNEIQKQAEFNEAMRYTIDIESETTSLDALNSALAESRSATGLTAESLKALKDRYAGVVEGFDPSKLFQESANGVTLNAEALNEYNEAYSKTKLDEAETKLSTLKDRWNELGAKIKEARASGDMELVESLSREREEVRAHIAEVGELASMYEGLSSSYNEWQNAEAAGSDRGMYESVFAAQESIKKELDNGWIDDGTTEYFQLIWGEDKWDSAGKSIQDYRAKWATLDDVIAGTSYSIQDFFKTNQDGELTSEGIFNFFDAVGQKQKELGEDWIKYDDDGNIASFNFGVDGDAAIADALGTSEELVQIFLRASQDAGFTVNFDGTFTEFANMENEAQAAVESLNAIFSEKGIELQFDFSTKSLDDAKSQLESAKKTFTEQGIWDSEGNFNIDAAGAQDALTVVSTLQANVDRLNNKYVNIKTDDKDLQKPLEKLQDIDYKTDYLNQLKLNPQANAEEIEKVNQEISKTFDYLASDQLSEETKIKMGIEPTDTPEDIQKKYESGQLKIPAAIDLQMNMDSNIQDLRDIALLGTGLLNEEQEQEILVRLGIKVESDGEPDTTPVEESIDEAAGRIIKKPRFVTQPVAFEVDPVELGDTIDNYTAEERDIVFKFLADPNDVDNYTPEEKETVVKFIAETMGVDDYTPEEKEAVAKYLADPSSLDSFTPENKEAVTKFIAEHGDIDSWTPEQKQAFVDFLLGDSPSIVPDAGGNANFGLGFSPTSVPDAGGNANFGLGASPTLVPDAGGNANFILGSHPLAAPDINGNANYHGIFPQSAPPLFSTITYTIKTIGNALGFGGVDGTAHAQGTAFAQGTTGRAFKQGSWGTKDSGVALMGELGPELVVRDGRWFTVGDKSAEFVGYKKDDIIFNAEQTKEIFEKGKITHGSGRGKALASGTAFSHGTGAANPWRPSGGGGSYSPPPSSPSRPSSTPSYSSNNNSNSKSSFSKAEEEAEKFEETFDWIEIAIDRIERAISRLEIKASSIYKKWGTRNSALADQIAKTREEIDLQQRAYDRYIQQANSVGLSESYASQVRDGTINIELITDENLKEQIDDYREW